MKNLSIFVWLIIPLLYLVGQGAVEIFLPVEYSIPLHSESGPHELLQFLIALAALIYALRCLLGIPADNKIFLTSWVVCFVLGCTYISGEEVSWGQHLFEWGTPEYWQDINDQGETNLHNTSSWTDQKPRLILLIGVLVGGLVIPAVQRLKPALLPKRFEMIYPSAVFVPSALVILFFKILDKIDESTPDISILTRHGEIEELALFYFVLMYLVVLRRRFMQHKR